MSQLFNEVEPIKMQRLFVISEIINDAIALKKASRGRCGVTILKYEE